MDTLGYKYRTGKHSSQPIDSVIIAIMPNNDYPVNINHIVLEGFSQWIIGRHDM